MNLYASSLLHSAGVQPVYYPNITYLGIFRKLSLKKSFGASMIIENAVPDAGATRHYLSTQHLHTVQGSAGVSLQYVETPKTTVSEKQAKRQIRMMDK